MGIVELLVVAIGLAMDAFAVSVCKGLSVTKINWKHSVIAGLYFGGFQAAMPVLGYFLGSSFKDYIESLDHWITFILLLIIGGNMIREAFSKEEEELDGSFSFKSMFPLAIATSIDALAVGVTFAFLDVQIVPAVSFIGIITFALAALGVKLGNIFGAKYKAKAEFVGGVVLILMGVKILLEHTGIIN